jgi:hypothetical protein
VTFNTESYKVLSLSVQSVSTRFFTAFILVSRVCFCIKAILRLHDMFQTLLPIAAACLRKAQEYRCVLKSDFTKIFTLL